MSGLATLHEGKMTRFPAAGCAAAVTSKPWGTTTAETQTQAQSLLQRLLHGERAISRPPSHPLPSSPPSSESLFCCITYSSPLGHTFSMLVSSLYIFYVFYVCFFSLLPATSSRTYLNKCVQSCLFLHGFFFWTRVNLGVCFNIILKRNLHYEFAKYCNLLVLSEHPGMYSRYALWMLCCNTALACKSFV